jgi:hypothetical protein
MVRDLMLTKALVHMPRYLPAGQRLGGVGSGEAS